MAIYEPAGISPPGRAESCRHDMILTQSIYLRVGAFFIRVTQNMNILLIVKKTEIRLSTAGIVDFFDISKMIKVYRAKAVRSIDRAAFRNPV